jgi:hypothetical protein
MVVAPEQLHRACDASHFRWDANLGPSGALPCRRKALHTSSRDLPGATNPLSSSTKELHSGTMTFPIGRAALQGATMTLPLDREIDRRLELFL